MEIYIHRDGQQQGPYTLEQVNTFLAEGSLQATDLAFHEGLADWVPLSQVSGVVVPGATHIEPQEPETASVVAGPAPSGGKRKILVLGGIAAGLIAVSIGVWFL